MILQKEEIKAERSAKRTLYLVFLGEGRGGGGEEGGKNYQKKRNGVRDAAVKNHKTIGPYLHLQNGWGGKKKDLGVERKEEKGGGKRITDCSFPFCINWSSG